MKKVSRCVELVLNTKLNCLWNDLAGCAGEKPAEQRCGADAGDAGSSLLHHVRSGAGSVQACGGDVMC